MSFVTSPQHLPACSLSCAAFAGIALKGYAVAGQHLHAVVRTRRVAAEAASEARLIMCCNQTAASQPQPDEETTFSIPSSSPQPQPQCSNATARQWCRCNVQEANSHSVVKVTTHKPGIIRLSQLHITTQTCTCHSLATDTRVTPSSLTDDVIYGGQAPSVAHTQKNGGIAYAATYSFGG